jgi:Uma2 family endonuclease
MGHPADALQAESFDELYERIRNLPEGMTGEILVPNVLKTMSRPGKRHRRSALRCVDALRSFNANLNGTGWWIEVEAEVRLPGNRLVVPDLIGYRVERVPELPEENPLTIVPDWACEVLSPSTEKDDTTIKRPLYARCGISWIWIVDPAKRLIEVYETIDGRPALTALAKEDERVVLPPFGVEFDVGPFWLPDAPPER